MMNYRILILCFSLMLSNFTLANLVDPKLDRAQITELAEEAYIYGLQQAVFYGMRYGYTQLVPSPTYVGINQFKWNRRPVTPDFKDVVTPNATTMYGLGFYDLSAEPMVVELPEIKDRYFSFQAMDQYGDFFYYTGNQFSGTDKQRFLLIGADWNGKLPTGFSGNQLVRAPSNAGFMVVRIALENHSTSEVATINNYQDQVTTTALSDWHRNGGKGLSLDGRAKVQGTYPSFPRMAKLTKKLVQHQTAMDYLQILSLALNDPSMTKRRDSIKETQTLTRLAKIGLAEGVKFNPAKLSKVQRQALQEGIDSGYKKVRASMIKSLVDMNGWLLISFAGDYGNDYLTRALLGDVGFGGSAAKSHTGAFLFKDSKGNQLNGQHRYTLTFDMNSLPPVTEFWSIPIYDIDGYFVENAINRYTVNSFALEQGEYFVDDAGKLTFYIQHEKPIDPEKLKNWLPAPADDFRFASRFYGPHTPLVDGSYTMPSVSPVDE